jgi:gliding motility-associated-like protein
MQRYFIRLLLVTAAVLQCSALFGTHNRAGEITYRHVSGFTYEVTITTYTKLSAPADRCQLNLNWGDGTETTLPRVNGGAGSCSPGATMGVDIGNDVKLNIYRGQHTYQSAGFYTLSMQDLNRNAGVVNIPNSVNVPFYVSTTLLINPALGPNNSPRLLNPPLDDGCTNRLFVHNPSAFDDDGDSLYYDLVDCRGMAGMPIAETYAPNLVQDPVGIDGFTGDFKWEFPRQIGQFNFAIRIREYRKGPNGVWQEIGSVVRDMQININPCNNNPPTIDPLGPFCVEAGTTLNFIVNASDPDNDEITLTASGGPFEVPFPANFPQPTTALGATSRPFSWNTQCLHVRQQPYFANFFVIDRPTFFNEPRLSFTRPVEILVVGPSPKNPTATPRFDEIEVGWDASVCTEVVSYDIYRRRGFFGFIPDSCELGVPEYTGYELIGSTSGHLATSYVDTFDLEFGASYCYMIVARFPDGAESYASLEVCTQLPRVVPIITHADVRATSPTAGAIQVSWLKPTEIDSAIFLPPYRYEIYRANGINGGNFQFVNGLNYDDTTYFDSELDTESNGYRYRIDFFAEGGNRLVGRSTPASSVFLTIRPGNARNRLTINHNTPWDNYEFVIYRDAGTGTFTALDTTISREYIDTGLINDQEYCYLIEAFGRYSASGFPDPLINFSQEACAMPQDTSIPCAPFLSAVSDCEANYLELSWEYPEDEGCVEDIEYFNIYYKPTVEATYPEDPTLSGLTSLRYNFFPDGIVGCYVVTAVEGGVASPRESRFSNEICVESCPVIRLPNVFSPNGDNVNDFFRPIDFRDVSAIQFAVFNRWGIKVFETSDLNQFVQTGWDGRDMTTGRFVAEGVYFYTLEYVPAGLGAPVTENLNGTVTVVR